MLKNSALWGFRSWEVAIWEVDPQSLAWTGNAGFPFLLPMSGSAFCPSGIFPKPGSRHSEESILKRWLERVMRCYQIWPVLIFPKAFFCRQLPLEDGEAEVKGGDDGGDDGDDER